jgi:hypothetical protein
MNKKFIFIAASISIGILILILIISPSKKSDPILDTAPISTSSESSFGFLNLSAEKKTSASSYVDQIQNKLPLLTEGFQTSVDIAIDINVFRLEDDPKEIVRLEITGLSYLNTDTNEKTNPNVTAFKEGYAKAIEMLESVNIDPKRLIFVYGGKDYVRKTSQIWIDTLKLKP